MCARPSLCRQLCGDVIAAAEAIKEAIVEKCAQSYVDWELIVTHKSDEPANFKKTYSSEAKLVTPDMIAGKLDWQP